MSVSSCNHCPRLISRSWIPGGNPVATSDPEHWATDSRGCDSCGATLCAGCTPLVIIVCPLCNGPIDVPPPEGPYVYTGPTKIHPAVKPGPGPNDLMSVASEPASILSFFRSERSSYEFNRAEFMGLNIIWRMLGSPRAWQLGGEQVLRQLEPEHLKAVVNWAEAVIGEKQEDGTPSIKPNQRYLYSHEPPVTFTGDMPELDLCDVELVEERFWLVTMPIEFLHAVAQLGEANP